MSETKMNKTRRCAGRLHASFWLKCNLIFTIKNIPFFFNQSGTFPSKAFWSRFDPNATIKQTTKVFKSQSAPKHRKRSSRVAFGQEQRTLTPYQSNLHSKTIPRRLIAYRPTVPQLQTSHSRTIYTRSASDSLSGGRRRSVSFLKSQLLFI